MKNAVLLAAGALLGSASAGVHKMKLQKVPLSEQLVGSTSQIAAVLARCINRSYVAGEDGYQYSYQSTWSEVYGHSPSTAPGRDVQGYFAPC